MSPLQSRPWGLFGPRLWALVMALGLLASAGPVRAGLFDDEEARKAILELRGGEAARRGIRAGDRVLHSAFR